MNFSNIIGLVFLAITLTSVYSEPVRFDNYKVFSVIPHNEKDLEILNFFKKSQVMNVLLLTRKLYFI